MVTFEMSVLKRANDERARGVHPELPRPTQQRLARRDAPLDERDVEQTEEPPEPQHRVDARRVVSQETVERAVAPPVDDPEIFAVRRDVMAADVVLGMQQQARSLRRLHPCRPRAPSPVLSPARSTDVSQDSKTSNFMSFPLFPGSKILAKM